MRSLRLRRSSRPTRGVPPRRLVDITTRRTLNGRTRTASIPSSPSDHEDVIQPIHRDTEGTPRTPPPVTEQGVPDQIAELRHHFERLLRQQSEQHSRDKANFERELASIRHSQETPVRRPTSASSISSGSEFLGFSEHQRFSVSQQCPSSSVQVSSPLERATIVSQSAMVPPLTSTSASHIHTHHRSAPPLIMTAPGLDGAGVAARDDVYTSARYNSTGAGQLGTQPASQYLMHSSSAHNQYVPHAHPSTFLQTTHHPSNYVSQAPLLTNQQHTTHPHTFRPSAYQPPPTFKTPSRPSANNPSSAGYQPHMFGNQPHTGQPPAGLQPHASMQPPPGRYCDNRRTHDLPKFSGRPEEWFLFINSFVMTTQQFGYTDTENMLRLQKCLVGDAKKRVESVLVRPEHVARTLAMLEKAFGDPELLVESQINLARSLPKVSENNPKQLIDFSLVVDGVVAYLECEATQHHLYNTFLLNELECKLPMSERKSWTKLRLRIRPYPSIRDFAQWLDETASIMASIRTYTSMNDNATSARTKPTRATTSKPSDKFVLLNVTPEPANKSSSETCAFCEEAHHIRGCPVFLRLSVRSRLEEIKKNPICYGCLQKGHLIPACEHKKKCGTNGCEYWHDPLLHLDQNLPAASKTSQTHRKKKGPNVSGINQDNVASNTAVNAANQPDTPSASTNVRSTVLNCRVMQSDRLLLFRVLPVVLFGPQRKVETYALLDEGSSVSLIDDTLAEELDLDGVDADLDLQFANAQGTYQASRMVRFGISGVQSTSQRFELCNVYATSSLTLPTQTVNRANIIATNEHLRDIPFAEFHAARPRLLIGLDHHHIGVPLETRTNATSDGILATLTKLGWVLYGSDKSSVLPNAVVLHVRHQSEDDNRWTELNELVRNHFTTEDFGCKAITKVIESDEVSRARHILESTTKRVGARFETGLLWARDDIDLPDNYAMALQRLSGVEQRMRRDQSYAEQYRKQIQAYLDKGYARRATEAEAAQRGGRTWFLPHFAVRNINKPGKFRLVFDAAARMANVSLNSVLLSGPDMNVPLTRLLFRFRLGSIGVCADVREMYHQVLIRHEDQTAQRFLWRDGDPKKSPEVFIMNVMTFGSTCSPASAQFVKNTNASEFATEYPEAAAVVCNNHYVDDYVASFPTTDEAIRITNDVVEIQKQGGFDLRGVVSNCQELQQRFGQGNDTQTVQLEPECLLQKILGMTWETGEDMFRFETHFGRVRPGIMDGTRVPTKRDILSVTMSIFDPFGLLADFLLASKVVLQELWRTDIGWDDPIPNSINERWQTWRALIEQTRLVRVPRCYSPSILSAPGLQLHVYADASEEAFSAVAYWRIQSPSGVEIVFVAGKVRCAPIKVLSIPRMELQAALLAARLMLEIRDSHAEINIEKTVMWSDSETVLKWINCSQRRYKVFVAVRVAELVESAPAVWWRWVPSALNPADDATRVKTPLTFDAGSRWLKGPAWLAEPEANWPMKSNSRVIVEDDDEVRSKFIGAIDRRGAVDYNRFSKYNRLIRTMAWVRRFVKNARVRQAERHQGELSAKEVDIAVESICRLVQQSAFHNELQTLREGKPLAPSSPIFTLMPYIDSDDGLLRVHGRTDRADEKFVSSNAKRPIILPHTHRFTELVVKHHHEILAHQLTDATIAAVRAKFWVPSLRTLVNRVRHACLSCKIRSVMPPPTIQGQLPRDRMDAYARPFTNTGLDFFGPVQITIGRRHEKRWVALFTCLTVRAVHLEIAADLSTDACLLCVKNLSNLRGVPSLIRCDNGTNFIGASNEIERDGTVFDAAAVQRELGVKGIEWRFNCPGNPEAGGAWERLVQSVKRVLRVTLHEKAPRPDTLRSLLIEAANIINARPLTHLQVTPDDPEPLTPNHFLVGGPNFAAVPNPEGVELKATRKQWQISRELSRSFWRQFVRDYLPELTRRGRHYPEQPQLQIDDLVIICDEQQPRSEWIRGRIVEINQAPDGIVRTAVVQTSSGKYRRPTSKLARLDVGASDGGDGRGAECRQLVN